MGGLNFSLFVNLETKSVRSSSEVGRNGESMILLEIDDSAIDDNKPCFGCSYSPLTGPQKVRISGSDQLIERKLGAVRISKASQVNATSLMTNAKR
jgi:hypothetical protein